MRTLLIALLAFATGGALVLALNHHPIMPLTQRASAPATTAAPARGPADPLLLDKALGNSGVDSNQTTGDSWPAQAPSPEQVMYAQPQLMQRALAAMSPRAPGGPNLYLVTFAGDGAENVFRNEAEYAARLFPSRYGKRTHTLVLENNPATLSTRPLANWSNLETALRGIAKAMNPAQDIVMLYFTSHGTEDHTLLVDMDPLPLDQIGASDLAKILHEQPFKWKVVVVNACYSGGFIPPLKSPGTLVITAARSDRSSFGCGSDSDITYFGRAFLVNGLGQSADFIDAFGQAKAQISQWEKRDGFMPSEPQIAIGRGIEKQLLLWRVGIAPGAATPFAPAAAGTTRTP